MDDKVNYAIVGVFVLALGAALIAAILWLASGGAYRRSYDTYQTYMSESVSGLSRDAPVRYRGVEVGRVRKMALASIHVEEVQLTLDIERGTPVKQDTTALLRVQGLTGIAYVELTGGSQDAPALVAQGSEVYPVIRSSPSLMVRLDTAVSSLLGNLDRASDNLSQLLDEENRRQFKLALADFRTVSGTLAARATSIDRALGSAMRTLDHAERASNEFQPLLARVRESADRFDRMSDALARTAENAATTLTQTRGDVREAGDELLPELRLLIDDLKEAAHGLRGLSADLRQNPGMLLYPAPRPAPGPGE